MNVSFMIVELSKKLLFYYYMKKKLNDFKTRIVRMGMNPADFPALSQGDSITAVKHMLDAFRTRGEEIFQR